MLRLGRAAADRPAWKDNVLFSEYFHGDNGAGLGASHQTGWTGIVADMIRRSGGVDVPTLGELLGADAGRRGRMIALGPQACGTLEESSRREWLVADGLGGYAMGTVAGLRTRRYHGLLVVAAGGPVRADARPRRARPGAGRRRRAASARHRRVGRRAPSTRAATSCSSRSSSTAACRAGAGRSGTIVLEREVAMAHGTVRRRRRAPPASAPRGR